MASEEPVAPDTESPGRDRGHPSAAQALLQGPAQHHRLGHRARLDRRLLVLLRAQARAQAGPADRPAHRRRGQGQGQAERDGGAGASARLSDQLHVGDVVQTETRAGAEISFNSGSVVNVRPDSVVYIGGSAESSTAAWRVQSGRVNFSVGRRGDRDRHPHGAARRRSRTRAGNIDVGRRRARPASRSSAARPRSRRRRARRSRCSENQAVQVDAAGKAGATLDLPPPPTLIAPAAKAAAAARGAARRVGQALAGPRSQNGVTYHVAIDYNVTQANLLLSAALEEPGIAGTSHDLKGLNLGRYFWRVAAVNKDGLEGAFSRVSFFAVVEPETPPQPPTPDAGRGAPGSGAPGGRRGRARHRPRRRPDRPAARPVTVDGTAVKVLPDGSLQRVRAQQRAGRGGRARHGRRRPVHRAGARGLASARWRASAGSSRRATSGGGPSPSTSSSSRCWGSPTRAPCSCGARASRTGRAREDVPEVERRLAPFLAQQGGGGSGPPRLPRPPPVPSRARAARARRGGEAGQPRARLRRHRRRRRACWACWGGCSGRAPQPRPRRRRVPLGGTTAENAPAVVIPAPPRRRPCDARAHAAARAPRATTTRPQRPVGRGAWPTARPSCRRAELRKLRRRAAWAGDTLKLTVYNGTGWRVTELYVQRQPLHGRRLRRGPAAAACSCRPGRRWTPASPTC